MKEEKKAKRRKLKTIKQDRNIMEEITTLKRY